MAELHGRRPSKFLPPLAELQQVPLADEKPAKRSSFLNHLSSRVHPINVHGNRRESIASHISHVSVIRHEPEKPFHYEGPHYHAYPQRIIIDNELFLTRIFRLSPEKNEKWVRFLTHPGFVVTFFSVIPAIVIPLQLLAFTQKIPEYYMVLAGMLTIVGVAWRFLFSNVYLTWMILKHFDFWYPFVFTVLGMLCVCDILDWDLRCFSFVANIGHMFLGITMDAQLAFRRERALMSLGSATLTLVVLILVLVFPELVNGHTRTIDILGATLSVKQMCGSFLFTYLVYEGRNFWRILEAPQKTLLLSSRINVCDAPAHCVAYQES
eukprot:Colp12_sorted_trinity150504_noHs@14826